MLENRLLKLPLEDDASRRNSIRYEKHRDLNPNSHNNFWTGL